MAGPRSKRGQAKAKKAAPKVDPVNEPAVVEEDSSIPQAAEEPSADVAEPEPNTPAASTSAADRLEKFKLLQRRQREATQSNRAALTGETSSVRSAAKEAIRLEKERQLQETLRDKKEEESGGDVERRKAWTWSIEQNEAWEKKERDRLERADQGFQGYDAQAQRIYKRNTNDLKPDLKTYTSQKEAALGLPEGSLKAGSSKSQLVLAGSSNLDNDDLNSLSYATHKPTEEDLDRLTSKLNKDIDRRMKFSRRRAEDEDADVTYINKKNKNFNAKLDRFYSKYTAEIKANFERGTAL